MRFGCIMNRIVCAFTAVVCVCGIALTGCGVNDADIDELRRNTLVVACDKFTGIFNPLYASENSDMTVCDFTQESLFNMDRCGEVVKLGVSGETRRYNGTDYTYNGIADCEIEYTDTSVNYHIELRRDVYFADGENLNADDVIFTMYVMSDPSYAGIQQFASLPIIGMKEYRDEIAVGDDSTLYSECIDEAWREGIGLITDFCSSNYPDLLNKFGGSKAALAMYGWGFAKYDENSELTGKSTGKHWSLKDNDFPRNEDLFNESMKLYNGNAKEFYEKALSGISSKSIAERATEIYLERTECNGTLKYSISNIPGIVKNDEYSLTVKMYEFDAVSMYALAFNVLPLHYYGDETLYSFDDNKFGFNKGDLSVVRSKNQKPLGAGPFSFCEYSDGVVTLKRNEHYYKGAPKIENLVLREITAVDRVDSILTDIADVAVMNYDSADVDRITEVNNGEISGDKIYTVKTDVRSYGYIGINADNVKVGKEKSSEESKALRSAFATLFAVYRDIAISSYFDSSFGCLARVIEYPVPPSSWASPKSTDEGYEVAFSKDIYGKPLYELNMSFDDKCRKALSASTEFFIKAGYEYDSANGRFVNAPEGASLKYTIVIPGEGTKAHPSYIIANYASEALASIGITLEVNDVADSSIMWSLLSERSCEMWAAAWGKSADPDLKQIYHSENIPGRKGSDCNYYGIEDSELDKLIDDAKSTSDVVFRKKLYTECFGIIMDWAVEVPVFTADTIKAFSTERVNIDTITPDITVFWSWTNDIEELEMKR